MERSGDLHHNLSAGQIQAMQQPNSTQRSQGDYLLIFKHYKSPAKRCTAQNDDRQQRVSTGSNMETAWIQVSVLTLTQCIL